MSEELLQRDLIKNPEKIGSWDFYNIGATTVKALKEYKIIRGINYGSAEKKKVDALIIYNKDVIAVIEYKKPSQFKTEAQKNKAIKQEIETAEKLGAKILIATDTKEAIWINVLTGNRIGDEDGKEIKTLFDPNDEKIANLIKKIYNSVNEKNNNIKPKQLIKPTDLAKSIWQDIWLVSGASPKNCLYTFVELFIFKYLSDLKVLQDPENFDYLIELYDKRNQDFVLKYYANSVRPKIKKLFPENTLDNTTIINGTVFVSKDQKAVNGYSSTFKTVLNKFNKYGKLENIESKKNLGQFFTPLKVVRSIIEMAKDDIKEGIKICDPACGVGKFLLEPIAAKLEDFYEINKNGITSKIAIFGFDKSFAKEEQKTTILAKANMLIYFSDLIKDNPGQTKDFAELFNNSFTLKTNSILGTLSAPIKNEYDLILTNPPYVTSESGNLKNEIKKEGVLTDYYKINAMGVEGLFMEWIIRALKPGGKAFVIIPDGILNRQNDKNLRRFILRECYIDGIISLPVKTFFTTPKKTYILSITKKNNKKDIQKYPVFTYLVSEIGESRDIYRFDIEQNDLKEAVNLYNVFKGGKEYFANINQDKRCKIQPIDFFIQNVEKHWIINKQWTEKEQIEIGIIEDNKPITLFELADELENVANNIYGYQEDIKKISESSSVKQKYLELTIGDIFNIKKGKSEYTMKFINKNKGEFPVYSSKTTNKGIIGYINTFDYDCECLTWTTDGTYVGTVFIRNGKFSMTTHCGALLLKKEFKNKILFEYLYSILNNVLPLHKEGEGSNKRLGVSNISKIKIKIPIADIGEFDLQKQKELSDKYRKIEKIKKNMKKNMKKIKNIKVDIGL
ncbi:MAG: N-6 DNA methylase [Deltaproteobacteria bacterium]|nr:N-6 DNA methylase [Deltaproteobacteria bacterium]